MWGYDNLGHAPAFFVSGMDSVYKWVVIGQWHRKAEQYFKFHWEYILLAEWNLLWNFFWKTCSDLMNDRFKLDNNMLLLLDPWYIWVTRPQSSEGCGLKIWSSFSPTSQVTISVSELQGIMESPFRVAIGCTSNLWSNYWQLPLWLGLCGYKYCHQGHFLGLVWY